MGQAVIHVYRNTNSNKLQQEPHKLQQHILQKDEILKMTRFFCLVTTLNRRKVWKITNCNDKQRATELGVIRLVNTQNMRSQSNKMFDVNKALIKR